MVDSARIYLSLTGQEWYRTAGFKEMGYEHGNINGVYRHTTSWLNRLRRQYNKGTPSRTLNHNSEQEGQALVAHLEQLAGQVLEAHQFEGPYPPADRVVVEAVKVCAPEPGYEAEVLANPASYEVAAQSIRVSIDPVEAIVLAVEVEAELLLIAKGTDDSQSFGGVSILAYWMCWSKQNMRASFPR